MFKRTECKEGVLGGKPVIKGTRISVEVIMELLGSGMSIDEILEDYKHLGREDILEAIRYAAHAVSGESYLDIEAVTRG
ncbi:MAG TPA: DUF433 domain-containing protein [bacterium]|nr:DUF433 domain-containing protein [bacterium]